MSLRLSFDKALEALQKGILRMASLVEQDIFDSVQALIKLDTAKAAQVIMGGEAVLEMYREMDDECIKLIARQQPIATDLRSVITAIKILLSLKRIGDYSVAIARATMCLSGQSMGEVLTDVDKMAGIVRQMVRDGLDSYVHGDIEKANKIFAMKEEVDYIFAYVFRDLLSHMSNGGQIVLPGSYLLYVNRYLERIADHATNIAEAVIYLVTGELRN